MELKQVHRTMCIGLAECVKSSTDYCMRFVHDQENNKPEKGSLINLATNFQKQVQMMDTTLEKERETNTVPMIAKKRKKYKKNKHRVLQGNP